MLLDPVNSITSVSFYRKVAQRSVLRAFGYLAYLGLLFSLVVPFWIKSAWMPKVLETFAWLEKNVPVITIANSEVSVSAPQPLVLRHPSLPEVGLIIDATRTEPVTPKILEEQKAQVFLAKSALYLMERPGQLTVYDFSKMPPQPKPVVIDQKFFQTAAALIGPIVYPSAVILAFGAFMAWKTVASLFYALMGVLINGLANGALAFAPLFCIAVHAQTLVVVLQAMTLFLPAGSIPVFHVIAWTVTGTYIWLAIKANLSPEPSSPPPAP